MTEQKYDERDVRPWAFQDEWEWQIHEFEDIMKARVENPDGDGVGCFTVVITADEKKTYEKMADCADAVAKYVIENPHLYGLQPIPQEAR